jgi:hypothetical protein
MSHEDDDELELEPIDAEILEHERQRGQRKTDEAIAKADVGELYEEKSHTDLDFDVDWEKLSQFRFTTRHLLILTGVLAVGLTIYKQLGPCMGIFVTVVAAICLGWFLVNRKERQEAMERARKREEFYASRGTKAEAAATSETAASSAASQPWIPEPKTLSEFKFRFSLREVLITMAVAAVVLASLSIFGAKTLTIALGVLALVGIAVQTFGLFDPPPVIVLGWWILLLMYLGLGLMTAFFPNLLQSGTP